MGMSVRGILLGLIAAFAVVACGGSAAAPGSSADPLASVEPSASPLPSIDPMATLDPEGVCNRIDDLELALARLRGVELKLTNRTALDIAFDEMQLQFDELYTSDLGEFEDELETPVKRLFYRMGELELAVEDFRTNSRPRRAAPHVEDDAATFASDLGAFRVLARC